MRNLSIKLKITLWYTAFMALLIILTLIVLFSISSVQVLSDARARLRNTVLQAFSEIDYEDGLLTFDDDINYLEEGVYISVYDAQGYLLYGRTPTGFSGASTLIMDQMQQVGSGQDFWYVYDYCQSVDGYGNLWIRGVASHSRSDSILRIITNAALILLPFFVALIALGGYLITAKALRPLSAMTETARAISEGNDLTRRIRLGSGRDEVHVLAHTFDQMMERLQSSFETEKQFTSDVSHELRTPVAVILSQCEYASQEGTPPEELRGSIGVIGAQARKMSALISQLLTLARADSGKQKLQYELVNLSELAEIIVEEQSIAAEEKGITLLTDIQPEILLRADETMMMRLFINLISNSITYGKPDGHTLVTLSANEAEITGSVQDDGIGIPADKLDKIWQRFYQVDPARTSGSSSGSGLGLSMVKWIVQAHGGRIEVSSRLGEGSCFTFHFFRQTDEPENACKGENSVLLSSLKIFILLMFL